MIKKYFLDILCVVLMVMIAFLAAERQVIDLIGRTGVSPVIPSEKTAIKEEMTKVQKGMAKDVAAYEALKERNIFSPDGSYGSYAKAMSGASPSGPLPQASQTFTLIGTLHGQEKKAVFRDHTGSIVTLTVGKKLIDGSVITRIDSTSVEVEKGKEKKELKIFDVKVPRLSTGKKP